VRPSSRMDAAKTSWFYLAVRKMRKGRPKLSQSTWILLVSLVL
jgi:hypothetical protein